jgi:Na+/H+ antiporter NhaD/arsenite permease-like protein
MRLVHTFYAVATRAGHPLVLLAAVTLVSRFFSAFLVNDAICLAMTPPVLDFVTRLRRNPIPYLLAAAMASNVGSTATITGNPQNMMIGSFSQIPYTTFSGALWPAAAVGLVLVITFIALFFPTEFWTRDSIRGEAQTVRVHQPLLVKSFFVVLVMVAAYFAGQTPAKVALIAGASLLITRRVKSEKVYQQIDKVGPVISHRHPPRRLRGGGNRESSGSRQLIYSKNAWNGCRSNCGTFQNKAAPNRLQPGGLPWERFDRNVP